MKKDQKNDNTTQKKGSDRTDPNLSFLLYKQTRDSIHEKVRRLNALLNRQR